jgi:phosphoglycolate phosphatase-like HAD superfamily hydrolase
VIDPPGDSQGRSASRAGFEALLSHRTEVYVVGDTPRNVEAAYAANATAGGVATGHCTVQELRATKAGRVLASLAEPFPYIS